MYVRKTLLQNGPENVVFRAVGVGGEVVRKTVGLQVMTEAEVYPTLRKILGDSVRASGAVMALNDVAQNGLELERSHCFLVYAEGYELWLQAGLSLLTSGELQEIGQSAPSVVAAFKQRIEQKSNPL